MRRVPPGVLASLLAALGAAACFDDGLPTEQVGGTKFDMPLNAPSTVRYPSASVTVHSRTLTGGARVVDSLTLVLTHLKTLVDPARYQLYLVNGTDSTGRPIGGTHRITRTDTTITAGGVSVTRTLISTVTTPTSTYQGAPSNVVDTVRIRNVAGTADTIGAFSTFLVVTIQANPAQSTFDDATPKPLWFRFRDIRNPASATDDVITASGNATFGTFAPKGLSRPYAAQGNGYSSFWDRDRDTIPELFSALVFNLAQPPRGYFYQPWMLDTTTATAVKFGQLTDTLGNSLRDADLVSPPPTTATAQLPTARFATARGEVGALLTSFTHVQLVLEPKLADVTFPSVTAAIEGALGDTLQARRYRGTLRVSTAQGANAVQGVTVYVLAAGTNRIIASGTTGPDGVLQVPGLPAGMVDVLIFPPAGYTIASPKQMGIAINRGQSTAVSFSLS